MSAFIAGIVSVYWRKFTRKGRTDAGYGCNTKGHISTRCEKEKTAAELTAAAEDAGEEKASVQMYLYMKEI